MKNGDKFNRLIISDLPSDEEMDVVSKGLIDYNATYPHGELVIPTPDISLILKDKNGNIVGGIVTSMLVGVMHLDVLWVDKKLRGKGYGKKLVLEAERIGKGRGYTASHTWTFSFQAPAFYQNIGYEVEAIFDGYTDNITEYILGKKFNKDQISPNEEGVNEEGVLIIEDASEDSMRILHAGMREYVNEHVGELRKNYPEIKIKLIIKDTEGTVLGGLRAYTALGTLHIEQLWIQEKFRGSGYGMKLLFTAEQLAQKNGCISGLACVFSFQNLEFFKKCGYEIFGFSDAYPTPVKEFYFKKKF